MQPHKEASNGRPLGALLPIEIARSPRCLSCSSFKKYVAYGALPILLVAGFILQLVGSVRADRKCSSFHPFEGYGYRKSFLFPRPYHSEYFYYYDYDDVRDACSDTFRAYYWATSFQLAVCVTITVFWLLGVLTKFRVPVAALLAVGTVLSILRAGSSLNGIHRGGYNFADAKDAKTVAAGFILSATAHAILLFVLGSDKDVDWKSTGAPVRFMRRHIPSGFSVVESGEPVPTSQITTKEHADSPLIV